ncbi:MAG: hypothetical protein NT045_09280 [Candidatus Aureabacteria bacterium]|nr:hypothetical protein [Candidatus Auribacterota bacterium]
MRTIADRHGHLVIDERYQPALKAAGIDSYASLMRFAGGELLRDKGVRRIRWIALQENIPGSAPVTVYLKQHRRGSLLGTLKALLALRLPLSPAATEWEAIMALHAAGVETMSPVALAERRLFPALGPSAILTLAAEGERLEDSVRFLSGKSAKKRCIIAALAECARRMHAAGLNHRDFYLSHIFLRRDGVPVLIDLQRVQHKARGRNRWVIKDLAALNYSAPRGVVTRTDRLRFAHRYLGVATFGARERRLLRGIGRKTEKIRRHDAILTQRKQQLMQQPL